MSKIKIYAPHPNNSIILSDKVEFVHPDVIWKQGKYNMDNIIHLMDDSSHKAWADAILSGYKVIGCPRFSKKTQVCIFKKLKIECPTTYFVESDNDNMVNYLLGTQITKPCDIVIKANHGARGLGQMKIHSDLLIKVFDSIEYFDEKEFIDYWKSYIGGVPRLATEYSENEVNFIYECIKHGDFILQEFVEIQSEYRVILFSNWDAENYECIILKKVSSGDNWQKNSKYADSGKWEEVTPPLNSNEILRKMSNWMWDIKVPYFSLDLYETEQGEFGALEFQMQFGMKNFTTEQRNTISNLMHASIMRLSESFDGGKVSQKLYKIYA